MLDPSTPPTTGSLGTASGDAAVMSSNNSDAGKFKVGANLDGTFYQFITEDGELDTNVLSLGLPFLDLGSESHLHGNTSAGDDTWKYFDDAQRGWLRDVQLNGTRHLDFSDIPLWIDLLNQRSVLNRTWVGPAEGSRVTHLVNALLGEFFGSIGGISLDDVDEWISKAPELFLLETKDS